MSSRVIKIKPDEAKEKFGGVISRMAIQLFVEKDYETTKKKLNESFEILDLKEIKSLVHTLKTNARYMCSEEFATECIEIENAVKEGQQDIPKLKELFPIFMKDFDLLYEEALKVYPDLTDADDEEDEESDERNENDNYKGNIKPEDVVEGDRSGVGEIVSPCPTPVKIQPAQDSGLSNKCSETYDTVPDLMFNNKPKAIPKLTNELRNLENPKPSSFGLAKITQNCIDFI